jgi:hypothetical protein
MLLEQNSGNRGTPAAKRRPDATKAGITMKYADGRRVAIGDRVKLWEDEYGIVVCSIDTGEFTKEFPKKAWAYLNLGILIKTDDGELFHYTEPDEDFELIKSSAAP